jgi:hypothetical protein
MRIRLLALGFACLGLPVNVAAAGRTEANNATYIAGKVGFCANCGADPLVRAGRPRPALLSENQVSSAEGRPTRGSAADEGVRPTNYAGMRL